MEEVVFEECVRAPCKQFAIKDNGNCDRSERGLNVHKAKLHSFFSPENNTGGDTFL
jgi:hypothetical protein